MKQIRNDSGLTVAELKELIKDWPETDEHGEPCEVWLGDASGLSNVAVEAVPLNYRKADRKEWADILIRHD